MRDKDELIIHVMHGYDTLKAPNGVDCFGCYINGDYEIYVADNVPTDQLFGTIAHEYMHYLQDIEGREPNEEEANAFSFSVFTPCYQQGKTDLIESAIARFEEEKKREKPLSVTNILWDRAISIVKEVAKEYMHSCYDCEWECLDGCSLRRDSNGNREPVYDGLTDCKDFVPIAPYQKGE